MTSGRVEALRSALAADGRAASMLVSDPSNIRWLTGFTGSSGAVVVTAGRVVVVTDGRYTDQARRQLDDVGLDDAEVITAMSAAAMDAEVARLADGEAVGAEATRLSHARWSALAEHASPVAA
ncbi:MAG: aminopeptidase P family N-terminal domain-containing protein, partial [Ilumatobacteraceae bacterium]